MPADKKKDYFNYRVLESYHPARDCYVVTPHDTNELPYYASTLRVYVPAATSEGIVVVTPVDEANDSISVPLKFTTGTHEARIQVRKVWSTGTTGTLQIIAYCKKPV